MPSSPLPSKNTLSKDVDKRPFYFPFGRIWNKTAHLNASSYRTIEKLCTLAEDESVLVLDAHRSKIDIFASAEVIFENVPFKHIVMPVASSGYYLPVINRGYETLNTLDDFEFYPVFRREDRQNLSNKLAWKLFKGNLSQEDTRQRNRAYVKRSLEAMHEGSNLVVVAPFGDVGWYGNELRKGVQVLLRTGRPVVLARSKFDWKDMRFEVFLSDVIRFNENTSEIEMRKKILNTFYDLDMSHRSRELSILWSVYQSKRRRDLALYRGFTYVFGLTKKAYNPITKYWPF